LYDGAACAGEKLCPSTQYRCDNKYQCIEMLQVMDGVEDCFDGSDENIRFSGRLLLAAVWLGGNALCCAGPVNHNNNHKVNQLTQRVTSGLQL